MFDPPSMERPDSKNAALQGNRLGNAENNEPTSHLNEAEKDETADQVPELKITTEGEPKKKKKKKPRPKSQRGLVRNGAVIPTSEQIADQEKG